MGEGGDAVVNRLTQEELRQALAVGDGETYELVTGMSGGKAAPGSVWAGNRCWMTLVERLPIVAEYRVDPNQPGVWDVYETGEVTASASSPPPKTVNKFVQWDPERRLPKQLYGSISRSAWGARPVLAWDLPDGQRVVIDARFGSVLPKDADLYQGPQSQVVAVINGQPVAVVMPIREEAIEEATRW